jgi:hypothetical protein
MITGLVVACVFCLLGTHLAGRRAVYEQIDVALPQVTILVLSIPVWAWITLGVAAAATVAAKDRLMNPDWVAGANVGILALLILGYVVLTQIAVMPLASLFESIGGRP